MKVWQIKTIIIAIIFSISLISSCKKEEKKEDIEPTENLAIDSIVATKTNIKIWEEIYVKIYARGENLDVLWSVNHGSMIEHDSITVKYWACPSCVGDNTIKCEISNAYGTISDTIMIHVRNEY